MPSKQGVSCATGMAPIVHERRAAPARFSPKPWTRAMLPLLVLQSASRLNPRLVSGAALHRRALAELARESYDSAERWFEAAAEIYRRELHIEPLARLRVHQLMGRVHARGGAGGETGELLEIVRRLNRLDRLERLEPPFEPCDARLVLAEWIERSERRPETRTNRPSPTSQAA